MDVWDASFGTSVHLAPYGTSRGSGGPEVGRYSRSRNENYGKDASAVAHGVRGRVRTKSDVPLLQFPRIVQDLGLCFYGTEEVSEYVTDPVSSVSRLQATTSDKINR